MTAFDAAELRCLRSVYAPPAAASGWQLEQLVAPARVRYYAYGRHALLAALRAAGVGTGDVVLLPEFICREVLSAPAACGARVAWYAVDRALAPAGGLADAPAAKAVLAVDYFGFAQDLAPFRDYCARTGAMLIEDNAHGLFSRDAAGHALGTRGDLGVFSLRKTLAAPDGAALVASRDDIPLPAALAPDPSPPARSHRVKRALRRLVPLCGTAPARSVTALTRTLRRLRTGHAVPPSSPRSETVMPAGMAPGRELATVMAHTDVAAECARRRDLYRLVATRLDPARFPPLFAALPANTVPYGYPFIADEAGGAAAAALLAPCGLECFRWPALPDAIAPCAPAHYRTIWMVSFLW